MKITKGEAKKQAILDTAQSLFYEKGYEQTSVQDIIDLLQTSKGSFYHHFESKIEVLVTLCEQQVVAALEQYRHHSQEEESAYKKLTQLFYWMNPIRKGNEKFLSVFFPLIAKPQGKSIGAQYSQVIEDVFSQTLGELLLLTKDEGQIYLYYPEQMPLILLALNNILWENTGKMLVEKTENQKDFMPGKYMESLRSYRFSVERLLDAPYGGLEMVTAREWIDTLEKTEKLIRF